jgi:NitT/TauT family transport system substrate-binding protein
VIGLDSKWCRAAGLVLALTLASGLWAAEAPLKLTLAMTTWVGYGPLFLARDLGYFKEAGLDVSLKIVPDSALYFAAMAAGRVDGSASSLDEIIKYRTSSFCFKAVAVLDDSFGGDGLITKDNITELAQLKGARIGLNEGSTSQYWFSTLAGAAGLSESDFHITNMTADDAAAAFLAGRLDAAVTWEPHLSMVTQAKKGKVLITSKATPGVIADVLTLNCAVINAHPQQARALVQALLRAADYIEARPQEAYAIMAKSVGGYLSSPEAFAKAAGTIRYYNKAHSLEFFADRANGPAARVVTLGNQVWGRLGKLKMAVSYDDLIDPSFIGDP